MWRTDKIICMDQGFLYISVKCRNLLLLLSNGNFTFTYTSLSNLKVLLLSEEFLCSYNYYESEIIIRSTFKKTLYSIDKFKLTNR